MFCPNCGNRINEQVHFCHSCGTAQGGEDFIPPPVSDRPAPRKPLKDRIMDSMLIPVAIILLLIGIGYIALSVIGRATTAQVTEVEQVLLLNNDESTRNPRRYKLEYAFFVDGKQYTGSVTRIFEGGSHMRSTIPVCYLPFWPHVNAEDSKTTGLTGPIILGVGVLLLVVGIREKSQIRNRG